MKRPSDQAKLLFFALLRGTATALATTGEKTAVPKILMPNIQLRLATRMDVPGLQRCNLECLPENYNPEFYHSHLRQWPGLALVAEHVQTPTQQQSQRGDVSGQRQEQHQYYQPPPHQQQQNQFVQTLRTRAFSGWSGTVKLEPPHQQNPKIVAYVLGKVEQRPKYDYTKPEHSVRMSMTNGNFETIGHVTSLAVSHDYRRQGLAQALMRQLHFHLEHYEVYQPDTRVSGGMRKVPVTSCGLHVRKSNAAACRLYENDGYEIANVIPSYYQDGEDAYFMKKRFHRRAIDQGVNGVGSMFSESGTFGQNCWKFGPKHLRLPRQHMIPKSYEEDGMSDTSSTTSSSSSPELMTGTIY